MQLYKVVMNGALLGQDIKNMLYYRTFVNFDISGFTMAGAQELAESVRDHVWADWKNVVSPSYTLESIDVYPLSDNLQLMYQLPTTLDVHEEGAHGGGDNLPPSAAMNIKFGLEPKLIGDNLFAPKRGYIAIAGMLEGDWNAGRMVGTFAEEINPGSFRAHVKARCNTLSNDLPYTLDPVAWAPIRFKRSVFGLIEGWADIQSASYSEKLRWRRSREIEN